MRTRIREPLRRTADNKASRRTRPQRDGSSISVATVDRTLPRIRSILVPTDFSAESEKALAYALPFARQFGAKVNLLHVIEPLATPDFIPSCPLTLESGKVIAHCKRHLKRVLTDLEIEPQFVEKVLVRYGKPFNEIAEAARALEVDLIIISTHGYTGVKRAFLGSTTERVVRHAPCPVLVLRPREHEFVRHQVKPTEIHG